MKTPINRKLGAAFAGAILLGALAALPAHAQTYPSIIQSNSPSDWWRFQESTPSPAVNSIANSASTGTSGTGYVVGSVTLGQPGVVGNSVFLSNAGQGAGTCPARIDIPNSPTFNPQPPFTVEFWAKPNSPFNPSDGTGLCPVSSLTISGTPNFEGARSGYLFYVTPGSWTLRLGGLESYTAICAVNVTVDTNSFTHVVGEFDGSTVSLYLNGVLAASVPATGGPFHANDFSPTRIGGTTLPGSEYEDANNSVDIGSGNRGWDGWVDEFAVYNTILSSNTVMAHYTAGTTSPSTYHALVLASNPIGYWDLDEPAYTTPNPSNTLAADSGSLADLGTNTLGALDDQPGVPGLGDPSVFYNGAAGALMLDNAVTNLLDVQGQPITLAAWINPLSFGYVSDIIAQGYDEADYAENFLRVGNAFDWEAFASAPNTPGGSADILNTNIVPDVDYYEVGSYDGSGTVWISAAFPAPPGDIGHWVFLVGTFDGVNWNLYRNGTLVNQFSGTWLDGSPAGPAAVSHPWAVGSRSNPNPFFGFFFAGNIAEPAIFTNALDPGTISNLYNSVPLPPVITQAPIAPSPAYLGSSATFSVWADGPGTLAYQWYSNTTALAGQTATNLSLVGLTADADATYKVVVTNAYGSVTSSVVLVVTPTLPPVTLVPATETRWLGSPLSFAPASLPNQTLSFQWDYNGGAISGATQSTYTAPANSGTAGSYTLVISNNFGSATSTVSTLSLKTPPNGYVSTILADNPLAYFRLDETAGPTAFDYAGGNDGAYVGNLTFGVPGYSLVDTDTAVFFPGTPLSYVGNIGPTAINFNGPNAEFSIEAWANGPATLDFTSVIAKGHNNNGTIANEQFDIISSGGFYVFFVRDSKANAASATAKTGPDGNWHHLVGVCDMTTNHSVTLYIDGAVAGTGSTSGLNSAGVINQTDPVSIGSESSGPGPTYDLPYDGSIDEVAIYPIALNETQVQAHYAAAYGPNLAPFITVQPVSVTNYVTLPISLSVDAAGTQPLSYQWNKNGGPIPGATASVFTIPSLASTDAGTYTVGITNTLTGGVVAGILSTPVTVTVLEAPNTPPPISGLVLHLTFDDTLADSSGRGNDATNEASGTATLITNNYVSGQIGDAFTYTTSVNTNSFVNDGFTNANYASLGFRPDLQFGANINFTVSMWVQLPPNYVGNDLPFFCDVVGSTFGHPGFCFEPSFGQTVGATTGWPGGWGFSVFGTTDVGYGAYGDKDLINDNGWHSLVYVIDRVNGATVYLDGVASHQNVQSGSTSIAAAGDISTTNIATIGQDPTGQYAQAGSANIDDLGVWAKALSPVEAASIYMAGSVNQLSFTSAPLTFGIQTLHGTNGTQLQLTWDAGIIQSASKLTGPWADVAGATSPYVVTPTNSQEFYRTKL